jgi:hypothetical protein
MHDHIDITIELTEMLNQEFEEFGVIIICGEMQFYEIIA